MQLPSLSMQPFQQSPNEIPYYSGNYRGLKGYAKALATLAYQAGIGGDDQENFNKFIRTDPRAKEVWDAANKAGFGNDLENRWYEFGNHFLKNEIIPDEVKAQQTQATNKSFKRAEDYSKGLGQTIESETNALRGSLAAQLAEARGNIKQQENARGMLYSGQRQKKEGLASNLASKQFSEGAGQIVQGAEQTKADLFGQANQLRSGALNAQQQAQGIMDRAKEARQSATSALQSQYASLLGQGFGQYAGSRDDSFNKKQDQSTTLDARNTTRSGQYYA